MYLAIDPSKKQSLKRLLFHIPPAPKSFTIKLMEFAILLATALGLNVVLYLIAFAFKTDRLTDLTYAASFVTLAWAIYANSESSLISRLLLVMIAVWALRLGFYLLIRVQKMKRDQRFDKVRDNFWKFGSFWLAQGLTAWLILLPSIYILRAAPDQWHHLQTLGLLIWAGGFLIETIADIQKYRFNARAANKGHWIDQGLWSHSRHPNYFGEISMWVGIFIFAAPFLNSWQLVWASLSPLWITGLLLFVTGVPPLERSAERKWGKLKAYQAYKRHTSVLIPWHRKG